MSRNYGSDESSDLRKRAEEKARERIDALPENLSALPEEGRPLFHELRVHQIELEMQNEELRRAQVELETARTRYFDLYDLAPVSYFTLSEKGLILEANLTAAGLLGVGRSALVKQPLSRFILSDDQDIYYRFRKRLLDTGAPQVFDLRIVNGEGSQFWARMEVTAAQDGESGAPVCRAVMSDITERKQAEEGLQQAHNELEQRVAEQTEELRGINKELRREIDEHKRAEEAVREERNRAQKYLDIVGVMLIALDADQKVVLINKKGCEILGYKEEEIIGKRWHDNFLPERHREGLTNSFAKLIAGDIESVEYLENPVLTKSGEEKVIAWHNTVLRDGAGSIICTLSSGEDITDHKRAEEALRESEGRFRDLYDNAPVGYHEYDSKGQITRVNQTGLEMLGYTHEEMIGHYIWELNVEGEILRSQVLGKLADVLSPGRALERIYRRKDGTTFPVLVQDRLVRDEEGRIKSIRCAIQDITDRKRAEEALRESEKRFRDLYDSAPVGYHEYDVEGRLTQVNRTELEMLGYAEAEMLGQPVWNFIVEKVSAEAAKSKLRGELPPGQGLERTYRRKDGTTLPVLIEDKLIKNSEGCIIGLRSTIQDITERKRAEKEGEKLLEQLKLGRTRLQHLSQRLVDLQETERRDLARELHDKVGQSLTALIMNLKIIQNSLPEESRNKVSARIDDSRKLVEETVMCIRDVMARLRPPVLDDYGLLAALRWYSKQFVERTGIVMEVRGEELNPRLPLKKETALFRIVQEALTNMAKHAKANQVTLILESGDEKGRLTIADDGIGFDPKVHHQPGSRPEWGMINMRERAESIGGKFHIETAPGKGTKIIVEVPRKE